MAFLSESLWGHSPGDSKEVSEVKAKRERSSERELRRQRRAGRGPPGGRGQLCPGLTFQGFLRVAAAVK